MRLACPWSENAVSGRRGILKSGLIGELATPGFIGELPPIVEDDMSNDDAGRRSGSAKTWAASRSGVANEVKEGAGEMLGVAAEIDPSLYVMCNPRPLITF